jgi:GH24 family phage-related lysozyme (muramidase)
MNISQTLEGIWTWIIGKFSNMDKTFLSRKSTSQPATTTVSQIESHPISLKNLQKSLEELVYADFKEHIKLREGEVIDKTTGKHKVYKDSLGKPTAGWGHLIRPEDKLKVGDLVPLSRVEKWFKEDSKWALEAAYRQAKELGHPSNRKLIVILASVNYQLGTGWTQTFSRTYAHLKNKRYNNAIHNLRRSLWYRQTPVRVNDFIEVIETLK